MSSALAGVPRDHLLDAIVFSSPGPAFSEVFVSGQAVTNTYSAVRANFVRAMEELWF
jgi:formimidoylglutamate deiminase